MYVKLTQQSCLLIKVGPLLCLYMDNFFILRNTKSVKASELDRILRKIYCYIQNVDIFSGS